MVYLIDKPGAAQSSFRIGSDWRSASDEGLLRADCDEHDSRRLIYQPTEPEPARDAWIYVWSALGLRHAAAAGPFTASAEIVAAKTDSGLIEFMKELNAIRDTVPTDELNKAKRYLQLGLPADFETTQQIATALVPVALYGSAARLLQQLRAEHRER